MNFTVEVNTTATESISRAPHVVPYTYVNGPVSMRLNLSPGKTIEIKVITKSYVGECETVYSVADSFTIEGEYIRRDYCSEKQCRGDLTQRRHTTYARFDNFDGSRGPWLASPRG